MVTLSRTTEEQVEQVHSTTAEEYAMIRAVLSRITGLRLMMVGVAIIGAISSLYVYGLVATAQVISGNINAFSLAQSDAIFAIVPFIGIIGYLSYRVNKHIRRLSHGRYEPPVEED